MKNKVFIILAFICLATLPMSGMEQELKKSVVETEQRRKEKLGQQLIDKILFAEKEIIQKLIAQGADVNQAERDGWTSLMYAAADDHEIVSVLINAKANINQTNNKGWTALMCAIQHNRKQCVANLINAGAALNQMGTDDWTPLKLAAHNNHKEISGMLIEAMLKPIEEQKNAMVAMLSIWKKGTNFWSIQKCMIPRDIFKLIWQCRTIYSSALEEIQKITTNEAIKQHLLTKYFPSYAAEGK